MLNAGRTCVRVWLMLYCTYLFTVDHQARLYMALLRTGYEIRVNLRAGSPLNRPHGGYGDQIINTPHDVTYARGTTNSPQHSGWSSCDNHKQHPYLPASLLIAFVLRYS